MGEGGEQAGGVEPTHSHTEIFIFASISRAADVQFFNVFISLDSSFHKFSNPVFQTVIRQKLAKLRRKQNTKSKPMPRGGMTH